MRYLGVRTMVVATQSSSVSLAKIFLESANWGLPHAVCEFLGVFFALGSDEAARSAPLTS